jgi:hypothetical protein
MSHLIGQKSIFLEMKILNLVSKVIRNVPNDNVHFLNEREHPSCRK